MKTETNKSGIRLAAIAGLLGAASLTSFASADTLSEMIKGGKASLDVRARYEFVDSVGGEDVNGYSVRTRLGLVTKEVSGYKAMLELEDLSFAEDDNRPGLDVPTTEINQLWLGYAGDQVGWKVGSQIYTLDDHRFIGHVGWRQNIQTFDALTTSFAATPDLKVSAGYLSRVNRVNATSQDLDGLLLNGSYKVSPELNLTGFAYLLDFDNWVGMSTATYGVRAGGMFGGDSVKYTYNFSYAIQTDAGDNPGNFDLGYLEGDISAAFSGFKLTLGYESMEGDGLKGFTTPLATVHKFAGFADVFAGRSIGLAGGLPQGLDDLYLSAGYKLPIGTGIPLTAIYHEFDAENSGGSLGSEIDLVATYKLNEYTLLIGKYANYDADSGNTVGYGGVDASMFSLEANFKF